MRNVEKLEVSSKFFLNRVKIFKILTPAITNCFKSLQTLDADFEDEDAMVMFATTIADFYSNDSLEEAIN